MEEPVNRPIESAPEEAALVMRLRVLVIMRWLAVGGILVTALVASLVFQIGFPATPIIIISAIIALYNLALSHQVKFLKTERPERIVHRARSFGHIPIILDMAVLTTLIHYTGGIENPFIFLFTFHIIAASIVLSYRTVYLFAGLAVIMVSTLVTLEYAGVIAHHNLVGFAPPSLYLQPSYMIAILVTLAVLLFVTTYAATAISGELRKRQRQVVQLRERLLVEKTGQLETASGEIARLAAEKRRFLQFIGMASHDLKSPLNAIQGFLWALLGGFAGPVNDKQRDMLERSSSRITGLLALINDLLDVPRIETGQLVSELKEISLPDIIRNAIEEHRVLAEKQSIKLRLDIPPALPAVMASAGRLQQVVNNLVSNAIKYNCQDGTVIVRVTCTEHFLIEIADTGIGIPPQELPRLFDDFFRASNAQASKGTGLGLAICRRIVEAHGGRIWAESPAPETGTGSKFSFTLPLP